MKLGRVRRVHFIGIGGSGMSGIAEVLLNLGYKVSGSDIASGEIITRLLGLGARIEIGHRAESVRDADVVVVSSAVSDDNPEVIEAGQRRIPVIPRAEMLGELMRMKYAVAVGGSHGKTSTTSALATVLNRCGLDPTIVIGGRLESLGSHAKLGRGDVLVAEADESDGSFLRLFPTIAVVTSIDDEHMDHYGSREALENAFLSFLGKVPFYGAVIACLDDEGVQSILPRLDRRVITYGMTAQADLQAVDPTTRGFHQEFSLKRGGARRSDTEVSARVKLATPGRHQIRNALAALAVADELGLSIEVAAAALENFSGANRRMQRKGEASGVLVVDDYGHHPTEIAATLEALREAIGDRRLIVLFQPHRYSRLAALFDDFARSFYRADVVVLTDVHAAGEPARDGIDAEHLAQAIAEHGHRFVSFEGGLEQATEYVIGVVTEGDVVLTLGAGSVTRASDAILASVRSGSDRASSASEEERS